MSCICPDTNKCPSPQSCLCGIYLDVYDEQGNLIETLDSGGYLPFTTPGLHPIYYFYDSIAFPVDKENGGVLFLQYNDVLQAWELIYQVDGESPLQVIYTYSSDSICPLSSCDWVGSPVNCDNCVRVSFTYNDVDYKFNVPKIGINEGFNHFYLIDGLLIIDIIYDGSDWFFSFENADFNTNYYKTSNLECPFFNNWIYNGGNVEVQNLVTTTCTHGYKIKTRAINCECCDEKVILTITHSDIDGEVTVDANIIKDEYGNTLAKNGKPYYSFILIIDGVAYTYYLVYDGAKWFVTDESYINGNLGYPVYTAAYETSDCPFGSYYVSKPFERFWVRGAECFDCCDYYAPKNRNLLKKKKAIFVDEISSIRNREIFGIKCGAEWDDLFRKHLIFDVLWCLPYGKICDEEQQCLINNLNENCNC